MVKSTDRGRTFTIVTSNLPDRHPTWAIVQDFVNPNLLFLDTEYGMFFTVDGGARWVQMNGGLPTIQVRDLDTQKRENDLVLGTFGRGFYVLDDYSAPRGVTAQTLSQRANAYQYQYSMRTQIRATDWTAANPPYGATFTYHLGTAAPAGDVVVPVVPRRPRASSPQRSAK